MSIVTGGHSTRTTITNLSTNQRPMQTTTTNEARLVRTSNQTRPSVTSAINNSTIIRGSGGQLQLGRIGNTGGGLGQSRGDAKTNTGKQNYSSCTATQRQTNDHHGVANRGHGNGHDNVNKNAGDIGFDSDDDNDFDGLDEESVVQCLCKLEARDLTVRKEGPNTGR